MDGHFEEPIVIGKAENPRCFKNIDKKKLPVKWHHNKNAWMTAHIMTKWLTELNKKKKKKKKKKLFFC